MMYQGIDLSRFKKVSGNDKASTLRHSKGHEIKIAHASLSPEMREHLTQMPVHLAEGGEPVAPIDPASPEPAAEQPSALPPKPDVMPVGGEVAVQGRRPPPTTAQELDNEDALYAQDLARGHIKPETVQGLFGKQDTMGKVGTLFGLLVGGAGSGLAHQPNVIMSMMQKEIDNDMEAQKASSEGAQNFLRLSHEHERNKADIGKIGADTELTKAQTGAVPSEIALRGAQQHNYEADTKLKSAEAAKSKVQLTIMQSLYDNANKIPPGPGRDNYLNTLNNTVKPAVMSDISQRNQKVAGQLEARSAIRGDLLRDAPQDTSGSGVDFDKLSRLQNLAGTATFAGVPGMIPGAMNEGAVAAANEEAKKVAENRAIMKMYSDAYNRLDQSFAAGTLNQNTRNAEIASLSAQIAQQFGAPTEREFHRIADGLFPGPTDWGRAREAKFNHGMEQFHANEANTPTLDRFKLKTPFPAYAREKTKGKNEASKEPKKDEPKEQYKVSGGVKYKRGPNGESIRVK